MLLISKAFRLDNMLSKEAFEEDLPIPAPPNPPHSGDQKTLLKLFDNVPSRTH
jgi:hypothetical protein